MERVLLAEGMNRSLSLEQLLAHQRLSLTASLTLGLELAQLLSNEHAQSKSVGLSAREVLLHRDGDVALIAPRTPLDVSADIRSLGGLLYLMLTGRSAKADVPPPSHFNPAVDEELDGLVMRCLCAPALRPQSARVIEEVLAAVFEELDLSPDFEEVINLVSAVPPQRAPAVVVKRTPLKKPVRRVAVPLDEDDGGASMRYRTPTWVRWEAFKAKLAPRHALWASAAATVVLASSFVVFHRSPPKPQALPVEVAAAPTAAKTPSPPVHLSPSKAPRVTLKIAMKK